MKHRATLECRWLTTHGADGRLKEGRWRCGDAGEIGMTDIPMSLRLCIWRGRRGDRIWMKVAGNGREEKLIWDSFWSICLNWRFFGERRGAQTSRHRLELCQGFSGKLPRREYGSTERERNGREKTQARLGRVLSQLPLSVCSAFAQRKSKIPRVQELSFSAKN